MCGEGHLQSQQWRQKGSTGYRMVEYHFSIPVPPVLLKTQVSDWTADDHKPIICYLLSQFQLRSISVPFL